MARVTVPPGRPACLLGQLLALWAQAERCIARAACQVVAGPLIAAQLAEFGADVIKIENADGRGDGFRMTGTFVEIETGDGTETMASNWHNVNETHDAVPSHHNLISCFIFERLLVRIGQPRQEEHHA